MQRCPKSTWDQYFTCYLHVIFQRCPAKEAKTINLQGIINDISVWTKRWRAKIDENKSVNFTNRNLNNSVTLNNTILHKETAKSLDIKVDGMLKWKGYVKIQIERLKGKYKDVHWYDGKKLPVFHQKQSTDTPEVDIYAITVLYQMKQASTKEYC